MPPRTQRSSAPGRLTLTGTRQARLHMLPSPRKPQLFVTQVDITKLSHCQPLQQQTPRPNHRPSASCAASIHSNPTASPPSSSPALSTPWQSSIIIPPLSKRISNPSARLRARRIITSPKMASTTTEPKVAEPEQSTSNEQQKPEQKHLALGEDDEFEDFPIDDWPADQTEAAQRNGETKHLWEESWDDDDTSDDFSNQLKEELKKVEAAKRR